LQEGQLSTALFPLPSLWPDNRTARG
jgi:hypothetical protein